MASLPTLGPLSDLIPHHDANFDVSCMLFGSLALSMVMAFMLDHPDVDIKKVSWEVFNKGTCTLIGVLISNTFSNLLVHWTGAVNPVSLLLVNAAAFMGWYILMQVALLSVAGSPLSKTCDIAAFKNELHFWSPLVSICGGCSNMKVWALGQQVLVHHVCKDELGCGHKEKILMSLLLVAVNCAVMKGLHKIMDQIRTKYVCYDGVIDEREKVWLKETINCEDNVDTMALAFLVCQSMRYELYGHLPDATGLNPPGMVVTHKDIYQLFAFSCCTIVGLYTSNTFAPHEATAIFGPRFKKRLMLVLKNCTGFSWLYIGTWIAEMTVGTRVIGANMQAAVTTLFCFFLIWVVDTFKDYEWTGTKIDAALELTYQPIALLIGFAWKLAFTAALKTLTGGVKVFNQPTEMFITTILICSLIIPAWKWYILPVVFPPEGTECKACGQTDRRAECAETCKKCGHTRKVPDNEKLSRAVPGQITRDGSGSPVKDLAQAQQYLEGAEKTASDLQQRLLTFSKGTGDYQV